MAPGATNFETRLRSGDGLELQERVERSLLLGLQAQPGQSPGGADGGRESSDQGRPAVSDVDSKEKGGWPVKLLPAGEQSPAAQLGSCRAVTPDEARELFEREFVTGSARVDAARFFWAAYYGRPMPPLDGLMFGTGK